MSDLNAFSHVNFAVTLLHLTILSDVKISFHREETNEELDPLYTQD